MSSDNDRLVSDTYKELADETTPEALNREVLRLAAKEGRTRYSIARAWIRPAAWAATIGLSLVIVLELANVPESDMAPLPQSALSEAAPADSDQRRDAVQESTVPESEASEERSEAFTKRARPYSPDAQSAEKAVQPAVAPASGTEAAPDDIAVQTPDPVATLEADDLASSGQAAERARQLVAQPSLAAMDAEQLSESDYLCPAEARLSADAWLKCIEELEASTPRDLIDREYEALRKRYPDFE